MLDQTKYAAASNLERGAYVLLDAKNPDLLLLSSGSEVSIAISAAETLASEGISARVISMPSWNLFEKQSQEYRDSVLPPEITARIGVEAAIELGWSKWLGPNGKFIGLSTFGKSAPAKACFAHFGITVDNVVQAAKESLGR